jgi:hypothetical protein
MGYGLPTGGQLVARKGFEAFLTIFRPPPVLRVILYYGIL